MTTEIGSSNVQYVYNFAMHGTLPVNLQEREILLHWRALKGTGPAQDWKQYPSGLERAILTVLSFRVGRPKAIGRRELLSELGAVGFRVQERVMREAIKQLRRRAHLICSMPGNDGGYYMAASLEEFEDFDRIELGAKIADMNETRQAMRQAARKEFGEGYQMRLTP